MNKERLIYRASAAVTSFAIYLPVLAGILSAMWYVLPLWYLSWHVITLIFPFRYWDGHWCPFRDLTTSQFTRILAVATWSLLALVFILGIILFLYGLRSIVIGRAGGDVLVVTGPYRWVRHPQHLGIILFLLAPALFLFNRWEPLYFYIRPSDILSWSFIAFGLIVAADLEEVSLSKRFGDDYHEYRSRISFMIPSFPRLPRFMRTGVLDQGRPARYLLWFALYYIIMSFILFLFSFVRIEYWL